MPLLCMSFHVNKYYYITRNPECQKYIGSYGKSAEGIAEFRFGSFFKIKFSYGSE